MKHRLGDDMKGNSKRLMVKDNIIFINLPFISNIIRGAKLPQWCSKGKKAVRVQLQPVST